MRRPREAKASVVTARDASQARHIEIQIEAFGQLRFSTFPAYYLLQVATYPYVQLLDIAMLCS
jgi:hypothetical protein